MLNKKAQVFTNVYTYIIILAIVGVLIASVIKLGNEAILNPESNLDNESLNYIANLQGIDLSLYETNSNDISNPILTNANLTQGSPKDESLDYLFAKSKGLELETVIKYIFSTPEVVIYDLLKWDRLSWNWIITYLNWFWRLAIIIALVYFVRAVLT